MAYRKLTVVTATLIGVMIAIIGGLCFTINNAIVLATGNMSSQMHPGMMADNQSIIRGMLTQEMGANQNITGSINLFSTIGDAISSQVKVSLSQAASTAENAIGNNSHALSAHLGDSNGYLTYIIWVLGPNKNVNRVIVDPADSQVLLLQPMTIGILTLSGEVWSFYSVLPTS